MAAEQFDQRITQAASMGKIGLVQAIRDMQCGFPLDFSDEYLHGLTLERLRHLYLALLMFAGPQPQAEPRSV
jgi:hypothetical protein